MVAPGILLVVAVSVVSGEEDKAHKMKMKMR